jgi:hypothetical protein
VVPPLVGVAINVTELPRQKGLAEADIVTLTGNNGLTVTGYWILDAGLLLVQVSEEVKEQVTRSPFNGM